jgi:hypothetical protein
MNVAKRVAVAVLVAIPLLLLVAICIVVTDDYWWLRANMRTAILDRSIQCWNDEEIKVEIARSSSRRDNSVLLAALAGAAPRRPIERVRGAKGLSVSVDAIRLIEKRDRDARRLALTYQAFWPDVERQRLFDYLAASKPICSTIFGQPSINRQVKHQLAHEPRGG